MKNTAKQIEDIYRHTAIHCDKSVTKLLFLLMNLKILMQTNIEESTIMILIEAVRNRCPEVFMSSEIN